ncbi:PilT/PilU family type 4a pilus ATPase [bacterium]|nr:PilT/PilU family type 4a pilus ATPase [bacterium]
MEEQLSEILTLCHNLTASDVHLKPGLPPVFRVGGTLKRSSGIPLKNEQLQKFLETTATPTMLKQFNQRKELDYSVSVPGVSRFRVNCFLQRGELAFVFRQIPFVVPTPDSIQLQRQIIESVDQDSGLILLCGPTGSGKSTTIAALMQNINISQPFRIITLEDPIEFLFKDEKSQFLQREFRKDFLTFPDALRAALRQDPDIIMVGEMRELETVQLALVAAETGHLVISTLHASTTTSAVERILGVFPPEGREFIREQLASVLVSIVAQALVPSMEDPQKRVAAREILINTQAIKNVIRSEKQEQLPLFIETGRSDGMITMNSSLEQLVVGKKVSPEKALSFSPDPEALSARLGRLGIPC